MANERITMRDLMNGLNRIEDKVDLKIEKIEGRLNDVETFKDRWMGYVSAISLVITLTFSFVWKKIFGE